MQTQDAVRFFSGDAYSADGVDAKTSLVLLDRDKPGRRRDELPISPGGINTSFETPENSPASVGGGTESGTGDTDPELAAIVLRWSKLPEHVRKTIIGIVQSCV